MVVCDKGYYSYRNYTQGIREYKIVPHIFARKNFNQDKMQTLSYPLSIFGRPDTHSTMKLFKNLVKRLLDSLGHQDYFQSILSRMCLNWRTMHSPYRNSTDIQPVLLKRPLVWMYFYPVALFLLDSAQRSNYSRFLNGRFLRGLKLVCFITRKITRKHRAWIRTKMCWPAANRVTLPQPVQKGSPG